MAEEIQKRQVAKKIKINDVLSGSYIKEDGWNPNFIEVNGEKVSRVNIIGAVLEKEEGDGLNYISIMLDDGSGKISGRVFKDDMYKLKDIDIGDIVLAIARPREYGSERYLLLEIVKKIKNKKWIKVRKLELEKKNDDVKEVVQKTEDIEETPTESKEEVVEEDIVKEEKEMNNVDKIIDFVREKDKGDGIDIQAIVDKFDDERIVKDLLSEGELFEIKPGRVKVLE
ncbi:hypothetical protein GF361_01275 [Candidatus Woesearchaeota archaeon]|nr:hypothetical protein [Candidatus Woesearchaeota archaeon]